MEHDLAVVITSVERVCSSCVACNNTCVYTDTMCNMYSVLHTIHTLVSTVYVTLLFIALLTSVKISPRILSSVFQSIVSTVQYTLVVYNMSFYLFCNECYNQIGH